MSDVDQIARRAVGTITMIAGKAASFASRVLLATTVVCVGGFLLGVAALSGGIEVVWIVLATVFGAIAIGGTLVARWRVGAVRRHAPALVAELRTLVTERPDSTRTVIETFAVDADSDVHDGGSAVVLTRQMHGFRSAVGDGVGRATRLGAALAALTTFPLLVVLAVAISTVFAFLGVVFLLALAL